jgi:hypothetical protein
MDEVYHGILFELGGKADEGGEGEGLLYGIVGY